MDGEKVMDTYLPTGFNCKAREGIQRGRELEMRWGIRRIRLSKAKQRRDHPHRTSANSSPILAHIPTVFIYLHEGKSCPLWTSYVADPSTPSSLLFCFPFGMPRRICKRAHMCVSASAEKGCLSVRRPLMTRPIINLPRRNHLAGNSKLGMG